MNIGDTIDRLLGLIELPLVLTENSDRKAVRVAGVLMQVVWFLPVAIVIIIVCGALAIPAMIQDA